MSRAYYQSKLTNFLISHQSEIIGKITENHTQQLEHQQTNAWKAQITLLQSELMLLADQASSKDYVFFEFMIPRMGKRADVVITFGGVVFVIEFKVGAKQFHSNDVRQAHSYALDLKNFHEGSHLKPVIPILIATEAKTVRCEVIYDTDKITSPLLLGKGSLLQIIKTSSIHDRFCGLKWSQTQYKPTPNIIEAAQALYQKHEVKNISRSDAGAQNISTTSKELLNIIHQSRINSRKSICFVTGVPGAGKTLVGLNIATEHSSPEDKEYAVFLSGNDPLVKVLREALAKDQVRIGNEKNLPSARIKTSQFIQNIHNFRDDALKDHSAPIENVVIFDEAQRAWNQNKTAQFMKQRGHLDFDKSEPEFLIEIMDRHTDWCTIIALIGGGQEINTGEVGLEEWLTAITSKFPNWDMYYSTQLNNGAYDIGDFDFSKAKSANTALNGLHLATSMRSFRSEKLAEYIHHVVSGNIKLATDVLQSVKARYPIKITRDLQAAKAWIKQQVRANESSGVIASSGAKRLKPYGIHLPIEFQPTTWFLNDPSDVRSCHFLEEVATEFKIQGLELDWCLVGWDADFRHNGDTFEHWKFVGTKWQRRKSSEDIRNLINSYRVLLTRARQGMVIFVPEGDCEDLTRPPEFYDLTYQYLLKCGMSEF